MVITLFPAGVMVYEYYFYDAAVKKGILRDTFRCCKEERGIPQRLRESRKCAQAVGLVLKWMRGLEDLCRVHAARCWMLMGEARLVRAGLLVGGVERAKRPSGVEADPWARAVVLGVRSVLVGG